MTWGILFWVLLSGYLAFAPDKLSHTATRGMWGAARGWANPKYAAPKPKPGRPGAAQGSRWAGLLAGWRKGVTVARQKRANGKDVWSRSSYIAGRAWGASESIRAGVRRIPAQVAAWRAERAAKKGTPTVQGEVIDPDPMTDQATAPGEDVVEGIVVDEQTTESVDPFTSLDRDLEKFNQDRTLTWDEIKSRAPGQTWACFDCFELILAGDPRLPYVPADPGQGTYFWVRDGWDCQVCSVFDDGPYARAFPVRADDGDDPTAEPSATPDDLAALSVESAPAEGAGALTLTGNTITTSNTTEPAAAGEENTMSINTTELESLDAVAAEVDKALQMCAAIRETLEAAKAWANGLADRWSGTDWGTDELDNGVAGAADAVASLGDVEDLEAALMSISAAVDSARSLAEVADTVGAKGNIDAFRAA